MDSPKQFLTNNWLPLYFSAIAIILTLVINHYINTLKYTLALSFLAISIWAIILKLQTNLQINYPPRK